MSMLQVTVSAMMRRKRWTILLVLIALIETGAAMVLCMLTERQETTLEETMNNTTITCVITDADGLNQDNLRMATGFVDLLCGRKHEKGYFQDEYVKNVRAKAGMKLFEPQNYHLVCLLTPDSDYALTAVGGGSMTLFDGWDASVFMSDQNVCIIPQDFAADGESIAVNNGNFLVELRIIGTHTGPTDNIYCPFHTMDFHDGMSYLVNADSCSFEIKDVRRLDEAKESLYEVFAKPDPNNRSALRHAFGVRINDEIFQSTMETLKGNLRTLHLLIPVLLLIGGIVGFFASYLSTRSRFKEYAVMRCLGMRRGEVLRVALSEQLMIALVGGILGFAVGTAINGTFSLRMLLYGLGGIAAFLIGTALSASRITWINVMQLMKTEE